MTTWRNRFSCTMLVLCSTVLPVGMYRAASAAGDLRAAALRSSELPTGFSHPHTKVYPAFADLMKVRTVGPAGAVDTTCVVDVPYPHTGWVQGMVEGFDTKHIGNTLRVCALLFHTAGQARATYASNAANVKSHIRIGLETRLASHVGTASIAGTAHGSHEIVFQHGRSVVEITYRGFQHPITPAAFLNLGTKMSTRLP